MVGKSDIGAELHLFHSTARDDIFYTSGTNIAKHLLRVNGVWHKNKKVKWKK